MRTTLNGGDADRARCVAGRRKASIGVGLILRGIPDCVSQGGVGQRDIGSVGICGVPTALGGWRCRDASQDPHRQHLTKRFDRTLDGKRLHFASAC